MGLPTAYRLKHRRDFRAVYQQGIRLSSSHLILYALSDSLGADKTSMNVSPPTRIGISISQKVSKKAVVRNRIKRQIRGVLQELLTQLLPGWKLVVIVRTSAIECEYEHFLRELKQLLVKAEVINGY